MQPVLPESLPYGPPLALPAHAVPVAGLARWAPRAAAFAVDLAVIASPWLIAGPVMWTTADRWTNASGEADMIIDDTGAWAWLLASVAHVLLAIVVRVVLPRRSGQSLGRRWQHLRVVDASTGGPVGPARLLGRELAHALDWVWLIGFLRPVWDVQRRTFADDLTATRVVVVR